MNFIPIPQSVLLTGQALLLISDIVDLDQGNRLVKNARYTPSMHGWIQRVSLYPGVARAATASVSLDLASVTCETSNFHPAPIPAAAAVTLSLG